ncbi:MAG: aconitase X [Oscillospiraceae bacterium]
MYSKQDDYEAQLQKVGLLDRDAFTCTCYLDEVGNKPNPGEVLSWAESSAVVFANSVLGARCNRNSGILELFGSVVGWVPYFGLLTDEGRIATWTVEVKTSAVPEAQILGSAIGMKVMESVPYIKGLDKFLGTELTDENTAYLKDFGAATASNGAVGLYHIENLTPEAKAQGEKLISENARTYIVDDAELARVKASYPVMWKDPSSTPKLCFIGCPHLTLGQLKDWTEKLESGLAANKRTKIAIPTVATTSPAVKKEFDKTEYAARLKNCGVVVSSICALMYMNNPLCGKMPVITNSNKLRTYTSARYYTTSEILEQLTRGAN